MSPVQVVTSIAPRAVRHAWQSLTISVQLPHVLAQQWRANVGSVPPFHTYTTTARRIQRKLAAVKEGDLTPEKPGSG
jgi:hypothetical protein